MQSTPACHGARLRAIFHGSTFFLAVLAAGLSGCGGGGGGGGGSTPAPSNQAGSVTISGTTAQGQTLTATVHDGNGIPASVAYQWLADGNGISGATATTFTPTQAQVGKAISVRATYTDLGGFAEVVTSTAATIADANVAPSLALASSSVVLTDFAHGDDWIYGLQSLADDKILAVGVSAAAKTGVQDFFALARYLPDGSLDPAFGNGGKVTTDFSADSDSILSRPLVMADGRIVVAGRAGDADTTKWDFGVARYLANGTLDTSFGGTGKVRIDIAGTQDWGRAVAMDNQSRIIVAGVTTHPQTLKHQFAAIRLTPEGTLDTTFGNGGKVAVDFSPVGTLDNDRSRDVLVQPDGKILLSGYAANDFGLARLNADGSLDATFGSGGKVTTALSPNLDEANHIALRPDGRILATGFSQQQYSTYGFRSHVAAVQYQANGAIDTGFGTNGRVLTGVNGYQGATHGEGHDLRVLEDGRFVIAGVQHDWRAGGYSNLAVLRYSSNGTLDPAFGNQGVRTFDVSGMDDYGFGLALTRNGSLLVGGGAMNHQDFRTDFVLAKFDSSGTPEPWRGLPRAVYIEGEAPVALAQAVTIGDDDRAGTANYAGYRLSIQRRSGPSSSDQFSGSGGLELDSLGSAKLNGVVIGSYTANGGALTISFNDRTTQQTLQGVIGMIAYSNADSLAYGNVTLDWRFTDEAGNAATASSEVVIANDYVDIGDPRIEFAAAIGDVENLWLVGAAAYYTTVNPLSHNQLDSVFASGLDTTDGRRSASVPTPEGPNYWVSLPTLSEMQALFARSSRPEGFNSGEYWTATSAGTNAHFVINMATGAIRVANDNELLHAVTIVSY